jgi:hypothetical protein
MSSEHRLTARYRFGETTWNRSLFNLTQLTFLNPLLEQWRRTSARAAAVAHKRQRVFEAGA